VRSLVKAKLPGEKVEFCDCDPTVRKRLFQPSFWLVRILKLKPPVFDKWFDDSKVWRQV
jgi:hypothetical protein